jgi:hypothetical protein
MTSIPEPPDPYGTWPAPLLIGVFIGATGAHAFFSGEVTRTTWLVIGLGLVIGLLMFLVEARRFRREADYKLRTMRAGTALEGRGMFPDWQLWVLRGILSTSLIMVGVWTVGDIGWAGLSAVGFGALLPAPLLLREINTYLREWRGLYEE